MCHSFHSNGHVVSHDNHVFQSILGRKIGNSTLVFICRKLLTISGLRHLKVLLGGNITIRRLDEHERSVKENILEIFFWVHLSKFRCTSMTLLTL